MASSALRIQIVEEPEERLRFRYKSENRNKITIKGKHSTKRKPTYPTVRVVGCSEYKDLEIQVSCVEANSSRLINGPSYKAHPFQLHGQDCKDGICRTVVGPNKRVVFSNIRIERVKVKEMEESLMLRQRRHVDPYREGFDHIKRLASIVKTEVRLCFELFAKNGHQPLCKPIVSDVIHCIKNDNGSLTIEHLSHENAPIKGDFPMILLCGKLSKPSQVTIKFSQKDANGSTIWEGEVDRENMYVHYQVAIAFKTPPYDGISNENHGPIKVEIQLGYPSENKWGPALPFEFTCEEDLSHEIQTLQQLNWGSLSTTTNSRTENDEARFITQPLTYPPYFESNNSSLDSNFNAGIMEYEGEPMPSTSNYQPEIFNLDYIMENYAAMPWATYDTRAEGIFSQNQYTPQSPNYRLIHTSQDLSFIELL